MLRKYIFEEQKKIKFLCFSSHFISRTSKNIFSLKINLFGELGSEEKAKIEKLDMV